MRKTKQENIPIKGTGHAQALSQEILAGLRRNSHDHVYIDDDSMENIDAYWDMANKELEEMERKQYEDISLLDMKNTIESTPEGLAGKENTGEPFSFSSSHGLRRNFDDEFQENMQNIVLTGFSDTEPDEEEIKEEKSNVINNLVKKQKIPERKNKKRLVEKSVHVRKTEKEILPLKKAVSPEDELPQYKLEYEETDKGSVLPMEFIRNGFKMSKIHINGQKTKKLNGNSISYILRGNLIVKDPSVQPNERVFMRYRNTEVLGRQLKSGAVFSSILPVIVHNPSGKVSTIITFTVEAAKRDRRSK